jgi:hypothetical protein
MSTLLSLDKKPFDIVMSYVDINARYILSTFVPRCAHYETLLAMTDLCTYALSHNNLVLMEWAVKNSYDYLLAQREAVKSNRLDILKVMKDAGACIDVCVPQIAGLLKYFDILRWCHSIGMKFDCVTTSNVASSGHLGMLIWLREVGAEWSITVCHHAAASNDTMMLRWLLSHSAPFDMMAVVVAAENGHLEALQMLWAAWLRLAKGDVWPWDWKRVHAIAIKFNFIPVIIWIRETDPEFAF